MRPSSFFRAAHSAWGDWGCSLGFPSTYYVRAEDTACGCSDPSVMGYRVALWIQVNAVYSGRGSLAEDGACLRSVS